MPTPEAMKRELFGDGPWADEPDRVEWRSHGFVCLITRQPEMGHLCGYVGVPPGHRWHGLLYGMLDGVMVHGGPTYSRECQGHVCHVPGPGEPDHLWWIGFDCAHADDTSPLMTRAFPQLDFGGTYKDIAYVRAEVEKLARQAAGAA